MNHRLNHEAAAFDHEKMHLLVDPDRLTRQQVNELSKENLALYFNLTGKPDFAEPARTPVTWPLLFGLPSRKPNCS